MGLWKTLWMGFCILIMTFVCSLVFDIHILKILAVYIDYEGTKNFQILSELIQGLEDTGDSWFNMVTGLWWANYQNFGCLYWFRGWKELPCPLSPDWGFGGSSRFLIEPWNLDHDFHLVTGLWFAHSQNFGLPHRTHKK